MLVLSTGNSVLGTQHRIFRKNHSQLLRTTRGTANDQRPMTTSCTNFRSWQLVSGERRLDALEQLPRAERLGKQRANAKPLANVGPRKLESLRAQHDHGQARCLWSRMNSLRQLQPVEPRHLAVGHDDVRAVLQHLFPTFLSVEGAEDFVAGPFKLEFGGP